MHIDGQLSSKGRWYLLIGSSVFLWGDNSNKLSGYGGQLDLKPCMELMVKCIIVFAVSASPKTSMIRA